MTQFLNSKKIFWLAGFFILLALVAIAYLSIHSRKNKNVLSFEENIASVDEKEKKENINLSRSEIKILFVGDMMFDRYIRQVAEKRGGDYSYILAPVKDYLSGFDLVVGNLEGPITDKNSVSSGSEMGEKKNLVFTFDPAVAEILAENNIELVNLGNNHILNQGEEGLEQTKKYLTEAGMEYFGDGGDLEAKLPSGGLVFKNIGGVEFVFVGYNYVENGVEAKTLENIKRAREQADIVIVCPHWGTEYKIGDPGTKIEALAHDFIDAGADAVIGTHPHVMQKSELYKGKKIYYRVKFEK